MSPTNLCRLCVNVYKESKSLYDDNGRATELYDITYNYFHPRILNMLQYRHLTRICLQCWRQICDIHSFEADISVAQLKLLEYETDLAVEADEVIDNDLQEFKTEVKNEADNTTVEENENLQYFETTPLNDDESLTAIKIVAVTSLNRSFPTTNDIDNDQSGAHVPVINLESSDDEDSQMSRIGTRLDNGFANASSGFHGIEKTYFEATAEPSPNVSLEKNYLESTPEPSANVSLEKNNQHLDSGILAAPFVGDLDDFDLCMDQNAIEVNDQNDSYEYLPSEANVTSTNDNDNVMENICEHENDLLKQMSLSPQQEMEPSQTTTSDEELILTKDNCNNYSDESLSDSVHADTSKIVSRSDRLSKYADDLDELLMQWKSTLKCELCPETFRRFSALETHFKQEHANKVCYIMCCGRKLSSHLYIKKHTLKHLNQNYSCDLCGICFTLSANLKRHMLSKHVRFKTDTKTKAAAPAANKGNKAKEILKCSPKRIKSEEFNVKENKVSMGNIKSPKVEAKPPTKNIDDLVRQWKPVLKCIICEEMFYTISSLEQHFQQKHPTDECYIFCCARRFFGLARIEEHARKHLDPHVFNCDFCDSCFTIQSNLKKHMLKKHIKLKMQFRKLTKKQKRTKTILKVKRKGRRHDDLTKEIHPIPSNEGDNDVDNLFAQWKTELKCDLCHAIYRKYSLLEQHFQEMHPEKEFFMTCCRRPFNCKTQQLQNHIRQHLNPTPFKCDLCQTYYTLRQSLRRHQLQQHSKANPNKCTICDKAFNTEKGLLIHTSSVHIDSPNQTCNKCGKRFENVNQLMLHQKKMHKKHFKILKANKLKRGRSKSNQIKSIVEDKSLSTQDDDDEKSMTSPPPDESSNTINPSTSSPATAAAPFVCEICQTCFTLPGSLRRHLRQQHPETAKNLGYKCSKCDKSFPTKKGLLIHTTSVHIDSHTYKCNKCARLFKTESLLYQHKKRMHKAHFNNLMKKKMLKKLSQKSSKDNPPPPASQGSSPSTIASASAAYNCELCDNSYAIENSLKTHMAQQHPEVAQHSGYKCSKCDKSFLTKKGVLIHTTSVHIDSHTYKCNKCARLFKTEALLYLHKKRMHQAHLKNPQQKKKLKKLSQKSSVDSPQASQGSSPFEITSPVYNCELCDNSYTIENSLRKHIAQQHPEIAQHSGYKCSKCDKSFLTKKGVLIHTTSVHIDSHTHKCNKCGKIFKTEGLLYLHKKRMHQSHFKNLMQKKRLKKLSQKSADDIPPTVHHQGSSPPSASTSTAYICELCDNSYMRGDSLRKHIAQQHPEAALSYSYKCHKCGKKFSTEVGLHIHNGFNCSAQIECKKCGKGFTTYTSFYIHKRRMHAPHLKNKLQNKKVKQKLIAEILSKPKTNANTNDSDSYTDTEDKDNIPSCSSSSTVVPKPDEDEDQQKGYHCEKCNKLFSTRKGREIHNTMKHQPKIIKIKKILHSQLEKPKLKIALEKRKIKKALEKPRIETALKKAKLKTTSENPTIEDIGSQKMYKCVKCSKHYPTSRSLYFHNYYAHNNRSLKHKCKICDKTFKLFSQLREHSTEHTGKDMYGCLFCPRTFKRYAAVYEHRKKAHSQEVGQTYFRKLK